MSLTVEKIGGTSMSRLDELVQSLFIGDRAKTDLYGRVFVVSAFGGITDLLLEHKKTGKAGVYALYTSTEGQDWNAALQQVERAMCDEHDRLLSHPSDLQEAEAFVRERINGARNCLSDLERLCSYGHFRLADHLLKIRELLSGLGEAHSALVAVLLLQRAGVNATLVDLTGWRDQTDFSLEDRLKTAMDGLDAANEMPIVTGYAQCREGLMREFDRGYSEVTFSRLAALLGADEAIIHKEFHLSSADPKLVGADKVRKLGRTNYDVADQLANMGMEAIHPKAARVLRQAQVPLRVTSAFDQQDPGTLIDDQPTQSSAVEIVTGLDIIALEMFEQDMVGVKGYDATVLDVLTRYNVRIVSKVSNANTITHYVDAPAKVVRKVEIDLSALYPSAKVSSRPMSIVSVIGRDMQGLSVLSRGLQAIAAGGMEAIGATQGPRNVDVQFILERKTLKPVIVALHNAFVSPAAIPELRVA